MIHLNVIRTVQLHDLRAMQQSGSISHAHSMPIRDVDFARHQDNLMATAGDDCMFRLWDLRCSLPSTAMHIETLYDEARITMILRGDT